MTNIYKGLFCFIFLTFTCVAGNTQGNKAVTSNTITVSAGPEYKTSSFHQWLWGRNYRKEWATPVRLPVVMLDTLKGGLKPTKAGGGNQTQSLQLETKAEKNYTLRSVNKTLGKVLPKDFLNTFIESIVNDKVSMSHPYGAAPVPVLAGHAGIYHTYPAYVYLPKQDALDTFNKKFGDNVYLFEQKIDGNWKEAANLGNFEDYIGTFKLLDKLHEDNNNRVDQKAFVKSRLFDMLINDWDRHEDQWEWGAKEINGQKIYQAVPQDRDQAFFNYNGVLLKFAMGASGMKYFQQFKDKIPDVKTFNYEERNLDRFFANQLTLTDWQSIARELQQSLPDNVIDAALKQLPPEIYPIRGKEIAEKLKSRRNDLETMATTYYKFIAKEVDVTGSKEREHFEISRLNENDLMVNIYQLDKNGSRKDKPYYSRTFKDDETKEVRLYGLSGNDSYTVGGTGSNRTKIRLIGGNERDSILVSGGKVHIYDNPGNVINAPGARLHLSNDTAINQFKYFQYLYSKKGISPTIFFNNEDRLFVGLGYKILTNKWRKEPFASKQSLFVNYSISQKAPRVVYNGLFPGLIGKWDLDLLADYDAVRWTNFFGLGNETPFVVKDIDYYRARTEEWIGQVGLKRRFGHNTVRFSGFVQRIRLINDTAKFIAKQIVSPGINDANNFAGGQLNYSFVQVNDSIVPTKGIAFFGNASYTHNIKETARSVSNYGGHLQLFVPLFWKFSLAIRAGGATVSGQPEFYQYASIGGGQTMRAFRRDRFWGKSAFYNSNEFRFISKVKSYLFNGKLGLVAFYDDGRVWMPNQKSDVWHSGYGGGVLISPFNKLLADITYGVSKDESLLQLRLTTSF